MTRRILVLLAALALAAAACNGDPTVEDVEAETNGADYDVSGQRADAAAMFVAPSDGDTVSSPVQVVLDSLYVDIVPAGAPEVGEAHFHVMVDVGCLPDGETAPGPSDEAEADGYYHLGDGSSERELELDPGTYQLCVQLADGLHAVFGVTDTIEVTVE